MFIQWRIIIIVCSTRIECESLNFNMHHKKCCHLWWFYVCTSILLCICIHIYISDPEMTALNAQTPFSWLHHAIMPIFNRFILLNKNDLKTLMHINIYLSLDVYMGSHTRCTLHTYTIHKSKLAIIRIYINIALVRVINVWLFIAKHQGCSQRKFIERRNLFPSARHNHRYTSTYNLASCFYCLFARWHPC